MRIRKERRVSFTNPSKRHDNSFYRKTPWRNRRKAVLLEEPLCRECVKENRITPATVVDHIIPRANGGADYEWTNLQPLCDEHHNKKTRNEQLSNKRGNY